jgi:hypothetical protein
VQVRDGLANSEVSGELLARGGRGPRGEIQYALTSGSLRPMKPTPRTDSRRGCQAVPRASVAHGGTAHSTPLVGARIPSWAERAVTPRDPQTPQNATKLHN